MRDSGNSALKLPVSVSEPVAIVGGGRIFEGDLANALRIARFVVAADGGATAALEFGRMPDAVVGDLDSLGESELSRIPENRIVRIDEQESTDFAKCVANVDAPLYVAVGFTGARLDHELANFNVLAANYESAILLVGEFDVCFALGSSFAIELPQGTRVSLFPFAEVCGSGSGLKWSFEQLLFSPTGRVGTSNEASGGLVELKFSSSGIVAILPKRFLERAAEAIVQSRSSAPRRIR